MKIREFHRTILYIFISGVLVPSFGTFGYYFMLDVVMLSKFTIAMLGVLGFCCLLIGASMFQIFFKEKEIRTLFFYSFLVSLVFSPFQFMFVLRKNVEFGIPDLALIVFTDVIDDILSQCLVLMPLMVLFAKICPKNIEATTFAFLTGTSNLMGSVRGIVGTLINDKFVGVT